MIIVVILILAHYNQNIQQNNALNSELNILEARKKDVDQNKEEAGNKIIVHLSGAVQNAGVYRLNESDRLVDLIKAAGGLKENADLTKINLAEKLYDGQKLIIPDLKNNNDLFKKHSNNLKQDQGVLNNNYSSSAADEFININQADQSELEKLSGIGPSKAAAIIKYREENSRFNKKEELLEISGIGEKTLENIEDEIVLR